MKRKLRYIPILIGLLWCNLIIAQSAKISYADKKFKDFEFKEALYLYQQLYKKDKNNNYLLQRIADSYRLLNDPVGAEPYYATLAALPGDSMNKLYYAEALRANRKYDAALQAYSNYLASVSKPDSSVQNRITGIMQVENMQKDNNLYVLTNSSLNSETSDFGAGYFVNNQITFSSNRNQGEAVKRNDSWTGAEYLDAYLANSDGKGNYTGAKEMRAKSINKQFHEGPACYDATKQELYITRSAQKSNADKTYKLKLYRTGVDASGKISDSIIEAVTFNSYAYSVMHPSISSDGKLLFFASDMPHKNARGGMDIYMSVRGNSGYWQEPINLGIGINTNGDEMFPFIASDSSLYFASNGLAGLGGLDIYRSIQLVDGSWSQPQNLGFPINTNYDDFNYIIDSKNLYGMLSSNRSNGKGDDDLYSFVRSEALIAGQVFDAVTKLPMDSVDMSLAMATDTKATMHTDKQGSFLFSANSNQDYDIVANKTGYLPNVTKVHTENKNTFVKVYMQKQEPNLVLAVKDSASGRLIANVQGILVEEATGVKMKFTTDDKGRANFAVKPGTKYNIVVYEKRVSDREFYFPTSASVVTEKNGDTTRVTVAMLRNIINELVQLDNIYFDLDKATLTLGSMMELDKIVKIMREHAEWQMEVAAFTDCRASDSYNMQLSAARASSTVTYLESKGIASARLLAAGYGETRPIINCSCDANNNSDCGENEHAVNRRVEFAIVRQLSER